MEFQRKKHKAFWASLLLHLSHFLKNHHDGGQGHDNDWQSINGDDNDLILFFFSWQSSIHVFLVIFSSSTATTTSTSTTTIIRRGVTPDRIPSTTPGAEPPRDAKDSGSARPHSTHLETSSTNRS